MPEVHEACERLVQEGLVRAYGVSVEKVEQALKAIEYDGVATVQIIFNMLRQRPAERFFDAGAAARRRRDRARSARLRPADRQVRPRHHVRRGRPPRVQPPRRGVRHGRDVLGGRLRARARGGRGAAAARAARARRWPSSRCAGSSRSTVSRRSSRARRPRSRRARTPPRPTCPRPRPRRWSGSRRSTASAIAPLVHQRW